MDKCIQGCLDKNTKILMCDGSERVICNIRVGDLIISNNGGMCQVTDIISGYEDKLLKLTAGLDRSVMVTKQHPVMKAGGEWVMAEELKVHDTVCINDDTAEVSTIEQIEYDDIVYNFVLEGDMRAFIANGFVVGDFNTQNKVKFLSRKKRHGLSEEENKFQEELEKIIKELRK